MVQRLKDSYDYELGEIQEAVEEAFESGIIKFSDAEVASAGEPSKRRIVIESVVVMEE